MHPQIFDSSDCDQESLGLIRKKNRLCIVGSRTFNDYALMRQKFQYHFQYLNPENCVFVSGGARGADSLAMSLANEFGFDAIKFRAEWDQFGKSAGYIRNDKMIKYCSHYESSLLAFWDGVSRGTKNSIDLGMKAGFQNVIVCSF